MTGSKLRLYNQVQIMSSWLDDNLEGLSEKQVEKLLANVAWFWSIAERRKGTQGRRASHEL